MRLLLDSSSEGGGDNAHVETIVLNVVSPKQDFAAQGGIHDALVALRQLDEYYTALNNKFKGGFNFGGAGSSVNPTGEIKLTIAGSAIHAALAPGEKIKLTLSGSDFTVGETSDGGSTPSTSGSGTGGTGGMSKPIVRGSSGSGRLLYEVTDEGAEGARLRKRRYASGNFDRSFREITYGDEEAEKSSILHDKPAAESAAAVSANILAKKDQLQQAILKGTESEVTARRLLAAAIRDEVKASEALNDLQKNRYAAMASRLDVGAASMEKRQANRQQIQMFRSQIAQEDAAQSEAVEQASRNVKARRIVRDRASARQQAAQEAADEQTDAQYRRARSQAVRGLGDAYAGIPSGVTPAQRRRMERAADVQYHGSLRSAAEAGGPRYEERAAGHYRDEQAAMMGLRAETDRFNESTRLIGKNMLQNIKHVMTWAASVGVLYGSIRLLTRSLEENMEIAKQQAILSQIFKGSSESVQNLTNDVLHLAAANGQSASEAMQSAVEWSRIFHTEREIIQATNASLIEANVSGEEAAKTTEFLSMMVQVYGLRASELTKVIGEMAAISQTANISNLDLMKGMEAVGEAAKEAGMSWSQTMGVITGGVSATKQSGTTIANTLKTMITQMANPEIQQKLRLGSGVEVSGAGGELKGMTQILGEMFVAWEKMTEAERRSLLFNVGGRQNATRMAGILDEFIYGQIKAVNAQLNLNSAEQENEKIVNTLKGQVAALAAEWDRFVNIQGARGPISALTDITRGFKNLLDVANAPGMNIIASLIGGIGLATGARMLVSGFKMNSISSAEEGIKGGLAVSTIRALKNDVGALGKVFEGTAQTGALRFNQALMLLPGTSARITQGLYSMSGAAKAAAVGFVALTDIVAPLLLMWGALKLFNVAVESNSGDSERTKWGTAGSLASAAAKAHTDRAAAINIAKEIIGDSSVPNARKMGIARDIASAELPFGTAAQIGNLERQNESLVKQGRLLELRNQLDSAGLRAQQQSTAEREEAVASLRTQIDEINREMGAIQGSGGASQFMRGSTWGRWLIGAGEEFYHRMNRGGGHLGETDQEAVDRLRTERLEAEKSLRDALEDSKANLASGDYLGTLARSKTFGAGQQLAFSAIGAAAGSLGTVTPLDERNRQMAQLIAEGSYLAQKHLGIEGAISGLLPTQQMSIREKLQEDIAENAAKLDEMRKDAGGYAGAQTRLDAYNRYGRARFSGMAIGMTSGEQMAEQQRRGRAFLRTADEKEAYGALNRSDAGEALQVQLGLLDNIKTAHEKIVDLIREETNLSIQANREYERSLLTSSPSDLLRKMAVSGLTRGRGIDGKNPITGGEFFSMSQEAREDFLKMPGNTEGERMARRGRAALEKEFGGLSPSEMQYYSRLPKFASGGNIYAGQPAIVGEKGPEIFVPSSSGEIIPNGRTRTSVPLPKHEKWDAYSAPGPTPAYWNDDGTRTSVPLPKHEKWDAYSAPGPTPAYWNDDGTRTSVPLPKHEKWDAYSAPGPTPAYWNDDGTRTSVPLPKHEKWDAYSAPGPTPAYWNDDGTRTSVPLPKHEKWDAYSAPGPTPAYWNIPEDNKTDHGSAFHSFPPYRASLPRSAEGYSRSGAQSKKPYMSAYEEGEKSVRGAIPESRYGGLIPHNAPQLSISAETIGAIISLGTEAGKAATALASIPAVIEQLMAGHAGNQGSHGPPPIAQHTTGMVKMFSAAF